MNGIGKKGVISAPGMLIHCQIPAPTLVGDCIPGILILKDWQVNLHMASWFLAGMLAMAWMPQSSWPLRYWWHWRQSWCCTPITLESMIWQKLRWSGWSHLQLLLSLASIPASPWCLASFLLSCLRPKLGYLQSFCGSWDLGWSWGQVLITKNWMVSVQVEWNEGDLAPLVWCALQWWLGQLTACLHLGLQAWHQVVPAYQLRQWLLTGWT